MTTYETVKDDLLKNPCRWLVTGVAGFIGSHLLETLLKLNQKVIGLDNFSTGRRENLKEVQSLVTTDQWNNFRLMEADIRDPESCRAACVEVDIVLHQAALGSVPRSIADPISTNQSNVDGFLNMLVAARDAGVKRFVYASSSSTYGDHPELPKVEGRIGRPLSPYAATKYMNELYAGIFANAYQFKTIGLRYFNIFGPRQDPNGAYAAVIPKWFSGILAGQEVYIYGDGETNRDFCYIANCVQANLLAARTGNEKSLNQVYNIACGESTSLNCLFDMIKERIAPFAPPAVKQKPTYKDFRPGDVRNSLADIGKAKEFLGFRPQYSVIQGLNETVKWFVQR